MLRSRRRVQKQMSPRKTDSSGGPSPGWLSAWEEGAEADEPTKDR